MSRIIFDEMTNATQDQLKQLCEAVDRNVSLKWFNGDFNEDTKTNDLNPIAKVMRRMTKDDVDLCWDNLMQPKYHWHERMPVTTTAAPSQVTAETIAKAAAELRKASPKVKRPPLLFSKVQWEHLFSPEEQKLMHQYYDIHIVENLPEAK